MKITHVRFAWIVAVMVISGTSQVRATAADESPGELRTIKTPGPHPVGVGDLVQVRYKTRATSVGIATLRTEVRGGSLRRMALVTVPVDPDTPMVPGGEYFIIVVFKVEGAGRSTVRVTPVLNDGSLSSTFEFFADARPRP